MVLDPKHPLYDLLHKKARYKVYWGGRGSGKSWSIAEALIRLACRKCVRILCVREFQTSIADSSHKILCDTIFRLGLQAFFVITEKTIRSATGSAFIFKGMHNNTKGIRSTEGIDICWVEEADAVGVESWRALSPTIRKPGSEIWVSYNLVNLEDATHVRFVGEASEEFPDGAPKRSDSIVHKINYDSNPFFADSPMYQEMLDDKKESQHLYEHIWLGMALVISDSIILSGKYESREFADDLWKQASRLHFGVDWGFANDPSACVRMFVLEEPRQGTDAKGNPLPPHVDLYISHEAYRRKVEIDQYGEFFGTIPDMQSWPVKADCARPEVISHVQRTFFYNIDGAEKWDGSIKDGIAHLRGFRKIIIHPRCVNTLRECRLYSFKVDKNTKEVLPIIIDKNNHAIDAMRYGLDGYIQRSGELGVWHRLGAASQLPN